MFLELNSGSWREELAAVAPLADDVLAEKLAQAIANELHDDVDALPAKVDADGFCFIIRRVARVSIDKVPRMLRRDQYGELVFGALMKADEFALLAQRFHVQPTRKLSNDLLTELSWRAQLSGDLSGHHFNILVFDQTTWMPRFGNHVVNLAVFEDSSVAVGLHVGHELFWRSFGDARCATEYLEAEQRDFEVAK